VAKIPPGIEPNVLHLLARRVLLDALEALDGQRSALVLVGAQAVYLHSGSAALGVAAFTSDGDLGLDPDLVADTPHLESALSKAGFTRTAPERQAQPGTWWRAAAQINDRKVLIPIDLLAPETLTEGRRGARLPPHDPGAVRRVAGLEAALEDHALMTINSLEPLVDARSIPLRVAGIPALLIAKAHKIEDRSKSGRRERLSDKDAADVFRLITVADPVAVAATFDVLLASTRVGTVARHGLRLLRTQFGVARGIGVEMAVRSLAEAIPEENIRLVAPAFIRALPQLD
jgi:hypothetical protein